MDKRLYGLTFAMVLTAGIAASNFRATAQLGPAMGKKWAEACLSERTKPAYREALERIKLGGSSTSIGEAMVACCRRQNTADSACKNVEKDQGGRTICEQGLTTCQNIVRADPGVKADLDKAKGIPFANNVSFTPNINWNFKSGTLGSASGTINITFQNP